MKSKMPEQQLNLTFGTNVRRTRVEQGLTQSELSSISGIRRQLIVSIELGRIDMRLSNVKSLADALGVDPLELLSLPVVDPR